MIGVLGLGSYSTLHFIKRLNQAYNLKNGDYSTCPFIMLNADFDKINPFLPNQFNQLLPIIGKELEQLKALSISKIVVPNITIHEAIDLLGSDFSELLIHPLKLAQKSMLSSQKKVLILGTRYTMESNYVYSFFSHLERIYLSESQLEIVDAIRREIYENGAIVELNEKLVSCVAPLIHDDVAVVIACTELSVLGIQNTNWMDLLELQIEEVIKLTDSLSSNK